MGFEGKRYDEKKPYFYYTDDKGQQWRLCTELEWKVPMTLIRSGKMEELQVRLEWPDMSK